VTDVSVLGDRLHVALGLLAMFLTAAITFLLSLPLESTALKFGLVGLGGALVGLSFWTMPDLTIKPILSRFLDRRLEARLHAIRIYGADREFVIDLWAGSVEPRIGRLDGPG
jgi:hypothetical protein